MPIGSQSRAAVSAAAPLTNSSNAFVANRPKPTNDPLVVVPGRSEDETLPSYADSEDQESMPKTLLPPSSDHDLEYFDAIASGRPSRTPPYSTRLVLNFYRNTETHLFPIEERMTLGSTLKAPFYVLKASPSLHCADEYNKLTITRWRPSTGVRQHAAISEILPRLKLLAKGTMMISKIFLADNPDEYELWWDSERNTYTIWKNKMPELDVDCEGWVSLDEKPQKGMLVVKSISDNTDGLSPKLAVIDFTKPSPQFICLSAAAAQKLDLFVISLLTVAAVHSRRPKLMSQTLTSHGLQIQDVSNITLVRQQQTARVRVVI